MHIRDRRRPNRPRHSPLSLIKVLILCISLTLTTIWPMRAQTQPPIDIVPPQRPMPVEPVFPPTSPPPVLRQPELPPIPPVSPEDTQRLPLPSFLLRQIKISGNTVFSQAALAAVVQPYLNRNVTTEDLESLRRALTRLYVDAGYINSGAVLPDQRIRGGIVRYHIVEGALTNVTLSGKRRFRDGYLRRRLMLDLEPPLNTNALQTRLRYLQQDGRVERLDAELKPGIWPGESELHVEVTERPSFLVTLEFNNYQSATIGAERGLLVLSHRNVTGHGDILNVTFGRSAGQDLQVDTNYNLPLTARDTTLRLGYQRNTSSVISGSFEVLDIDSESETWELTLRHPFYHDLRREFALSLGAKRAHSSTSLLGMPFSFSAGAENGETTVTALNLTAEWHDRTPTSVLAAQSRFTLGGNAFDATIHSDSDIPDSRFAAWLGQFQWAKRLTSRHLQLRFRLTVQLTTEPLLPTEQIAIGGRFSVRGYRENQLIRDNGLLAAVEIPISLVQNKPWAELVNIVPFFDYGRGWNRKVATLGRTDLASIGLGVQWAAMVRWFIPIRAQLDVWWGEQLLDVDTEGGNLQDKGLHLQFAVSSQL